tara:strand:- start:5093 stop:5680 length:588 start_codon:yes stop_codon:yes gene_type:complete
MTKAVAGNGKSGQAKAKTEDSDEADVGKIRDILFGAQMAEYEQRFKTLEATLERRVNAAVKDAAAQHQALQERLVGEVEKLTQSNTQEATERAEAIANLERSARDTAARIDERIAELDEHLAKESAEIRHELFESHQQVLAETKSLLATLDDVVQTSNQDLQDKKADRTELAGLFESFAQTLTRGFKIAETDPQK